MNIVNCVKDIVLLQKFFPNVGDVDLIVGSLLENRIDDALIGETTRCILSEGFYRLRYSDRFFCDVEGQPGSFSQGLHTKYFHLVFVVLICIHFICLWKFRRAIQRFVESKSHYGLLRDVNDWSIAVWHFQSRVIFVVTPNRFVNIQIKTKMRNILSRLKSNLNTF